MPPFSKDKKKRTHAENLQIVCCVCGCKKSSQQNVTDRIAEMVKEFAQPTYDRNGGIHPTVICTSCRLACSAYEKEGLDQTRHRIPSRLDYRALIPPGPVTRNSPDCTCSICQIAQLNLTPHLEHNMERSNPKGFPVEEEVDLDATLEYTPKVSVSVVICSYCKAEKRQGVEHICNRTTRRENICEGVRQLSRGTLESVCNEALKELQDRNPVEPSDSGDVGLLKLQNHHGGRPMPVQIQPEKQKLPRKVTCDDMLGIKKKLGLSGIKTKELAAELRVALQDRRALEPGLEQALVEKNHILDDLFTKESVLVNNKAGNQEEKTLVYCTNLDELIRRLVESRELDEETMTVKIGLDGGQGSLKVCLSVVTKEENMETGRRRFSEGVANKENKLGSVHRLIVLACMADAPENYCTVKLMLDKLSMSDFSYTVSSDIKMLSILLGKSTGNLTHGCIFCSASKPLTSEGQLYTLGMLRDLNEKFVANGSKMKKQADFQNVINRPLLGQDMDPATQILGFLAVPELHVMLGVVDKLRVALEDNVFDTVEEGRLFMERFLIKTNITRKGYQAKESLEGNQTRMFLKSQIKLRTAYEEAGHLDAALPYIKALEAMSEVVTKCFGMELVDSGL